MACASFVGSCFADEVGGGGGGFTYHLVIIIHVSCCCPEAAFFISASISLFRLLSRFATAAGVNLDAGGGPEGGGTLAFFASAASLSFLRNILLPLSFPGSGLPLILLLIHPRRCQFCLKCLESFLTQHGHKVGLYYRSMKK